MQVSFLRVFPLNTVCLLYVVKGISLLYFSTFFVHDHDHSVPASLALAAAELLYEFLVTRRK